MTIYFVLLAILSCTLLLLLWPQRRNKAAIPIALYFIIACFGLYALVGSPNIVPLLAARDVRLAEIKQSIVTNSDAVKRDPKNLKAWVELGQSFIETGQFGAAANAFKQAVKLSGGDPALIMAYAKSMIMDEGGKVSDHARKSLEMVLLQENNPEARYWLIVRKLEDGDQANAMKEMKALYKELPKDSPLRAMIDRQIGRQ